MYPKGRHLAYRAIFDLISCRREVKAFRPDVVLGLGNIGLLFPDASLKPSYSINPT